MTRFTYDLDANLLTLTDPVGNTTSFQYDARSRQVSETDPLGKVIRYDYDAVDNLVRKTDRLNRVTNYQYDELDRLVSETWVGGGNQIFYDYDLADNLVHVKDVFSELTYTYDAQDRVTLVDNAGTPDAPHVVLQYASDAVGNVLSVTDSIEGTPNAVTGYQYDALNRLATLTQTAAPGATATDIAFLPSDKRVDFTYNPLGQYEHIRRYESLSAAAVDLVVDTEYAFDPLNRAVSIDHRNQANQAVSFFRYQYDAAGRIIQIADIDGVTDYAYDDRNQLAAANHTDPNKPDELYRYDANGNRLESHLHGTGYQTGPANRLVSDGTYNYQYDDEGNTILRTEIDTADYREFHFDYRNRLVAVIDKLANGIAKQEVRFIYDAIDRRIAKSVAVAPQDAAVTHFVYDREDVIADFFGAGRSGSIGPVTIKRYLHGPVFDQILAEDDGTSQWLLSDIIGSTRILLDSSGDVLLRYTNDAFGGAVGSAASSQQTRYLFAGRESDFEIDLYYVRARFFSSTLGAFLSEDPSGIRPDENPRRYVLNDPVRLIDPTGLEAVYNPTLAPQQNMFINQVISAVGNDSAFFALADDPNYASMPAPGFYRNVVLSILNGFQNSDFPLEDGGFRPFFCTGVLDAFNEAFDRAVKMRRIDPGV